MKLLVTDDCWHDGVHKPFMLICGFIFWDIMQAATNWLNMLDTTVSKNWKDAVYIYHKEAAWTKLKVSNRTILVCIWSSACEYFELMRLARSVITKRTSIQVLVSNLRPFFAWILYASSIRKALMGSQTDGSAKKTSHVGLTLASESIQTFLVQLIIFISSRYCCDWLPIAS